MHMTKVEGELYHVIAEPGDATHYDFYIIRLGNYVFCFSEETDIAYPTRLWLTLDFEEGVTNRKFSNRLLGLADRHRVNPNTYNQVMLACEKAGFTCT